METSSQTPNAALRPSAGHCQQSAATQTRVRAGGRPTAWCALLILAFGLLGMAAPAAAQMRSYAIDPHGSRVEVLLRKAGLFSVLAHDHILVAVGFAGRIAVDPALPERTALQMTFPVASLLVDPEDARARAGLDGELDDADRAEIKAAMLAPEQLDGEQFPRVVVTLEQVRGSLPQLELQLRVRIKQTEKLITVPARVTVGGDRLHATGELELVQSEFGIKPYTALLGSIAVEDVIAVRFEVVGRPSVN